MTENCNLRCDYCYIEGKNANSRMPTGVALRGVDLLMHESRKDGAVHIFFIGGEPLLEFDLIRHVVHYAESVAGSAGKTVRFSTTTNGTQFTHGRLSFLREHGFNPLISIDGKRETHDRHRHCLDRGSAFDAIAAMLPSVRRYFRRPRARMTVHPDSTGDICENVSYLLAQGFHSVGVAPTDGVKWTDEELVQLDAALGELAAVYRKMLTQRHAPMLVLYHEVIKHAFGKFKGIWGCGAGMGRITVAPDGRLFGCTRLLGTNGLKGILPLGDVWQGITNVQNRQAIASANRARRPKCLVCGYRDSCCGGCYASNFQATGNILDPSSTQCKFVPIYVRSCRVVWPGGPPQNTPGMPRSSTAKAREPRRQPKDAVT